MKLVFTMTATEICPGEENLVLIHQKQKKKKRERKKKQARKKSYKMNTENKSETKAYGLCL